MTRRPRKAAAAGPAPWAALLGLIGLGGAALLYWGQDPFWERARRSGTLTVVSRYAPTVYYEGRDGPEGYEYELARAFAEHLGLGLDVRLETSLAAVLEATAAGRGDLAAAGLTPTDDRRRRLRFGPPYLEVPQQLVCRRGRRPPKRPEELAGLRIAVPAQSAYEDTLARLAAAHPGIGWTAEDADTEALLARVAAGELDCTVADATIAAVNRRYHLELIIAMDLTEPRPLAWALPPRAWRLQRATARWLEQARAEGLLERLYERHFGHVLFFDYVDLRSFKRRIRTRLPRYRPLFEAAAQRWGLDWTWLAAQAYQESHWDPRARSPTGVRGLMMLTRATAERLGVRDRLDPRQSIEGGARYLRMLLDALPDSIPEGERLFFALAAYNLGLGHVLDARELAAARGLDPDRWSDLAAVLPLLSDPKIYPTLPHGYARGNEALRYVERIRNYRDVLLHSLGEGRAENAA
ncbi:MAG: membrane-bound lytic murein transglycosylase F [Gammaproteobacteria bacterium]|nr:MAG: membrane-bound lytic murein transglycosylase F [Gammaproteobacteria bacterium]